MKRPNWALNFLLRTLFADSGNFFSELLDHYFYCPHFANKCFHIALSAILNVSFYDRQYISHTF